MSAPRDARPDRPLQNAVERAIGAANIGVSGDSLRLIESLWASGYEVLLRSSGPARFDAGDAEAFIGWVSGWNEPITRTYEQMADWLNARLTQKERDTHE